MGITGIRYTKASQNGKSKPSGLQVSFWKAQRALEEWLETHVEGSIPARNLSVGILTSALSDRQREQLHERKRARQAPTLTVAEQREIHEQHERTAA
jgi:hypothetical protein